MVEAYASATGSKAPALRSRSVLILFSGPYDRPDGLAAFLSRLGLKSVLIDNSSSGGGSAHDLTTDSFYESILQRCHRGEFIAVMAAPPCSTFSIARFFDRRASALAAGRPPPVDSGPPPVRSKDHITGLPDLAPARLKEVTLANTLVRRTVAICLAALHSGAEFAIENPADRSDRDKPWFIDDRHGPIWHMPEMLALTKHSGAEAVTFPLCALGARVQKYTTVLASPRLSALLRPLGKLRCTHSKHEDQVGGKQVDGAWTSASFAAYPPDMNHLLARVFASLVLPVGELVQSDREPTTVPDTSQSPSSAESTETAHDPLAASDNPLATPIRRDSPSGGGPSLREGACFSHTPVVKHTPVVRFR